MKGAALSTIALAGGLLAVQRASIIACHGERHDVCGQWGRRKIERCTREG
jgi:hypothetical protein